MQKIEQYSGEEWASLIRAASWSWRMAHENSARGAVGALQFETLSPLKDMLYYLIGGELKYERRF